MKYYQEIQNELNNVRKIIGEKFDVQDNSLSKYSRAMKEMQEQKGNLSLEEVTTCSILSHIINTKEFEQLKRKDKFYMIIEWIFQNNSN